MNSTSFSQRLRQALSDAGMIANELAARCSINKSVISQYLSGKYLPKYDRTILMAQHLGCSPEWLAGKDVPRVPLGEGSSTTGVVPVIDIDRLDAQVLFADEAIIGQEQTESVYCDGNHFILIANDDSMEPDIMEGDHVLCVRQDHLEDGQTGVFLLENGRALIRTQGYTNGDIVLISSCRHFPRRTARELGVTKIIGRVVRTTRYWQNPAGGDPIYIMNKPAIVFDLDGTLAPVGRPIPDELVSGLRKLEQRGHTVAICSGKPLAYLCGMLRQSALDKPVLIGENGAAMQVGIDLPPAVRSVLPYPDGAGAALERIRRCIDSLYADRVWYQPNEHMLTCFPHSEDLFDPIGRLIGECDAEKSGLIVYRHCDCFDIIPEGVDKGAGLREMCRVLDIDPANTVAIGDHDNDLPMFLAAGLSIGVGASSPAEARLHFDDAGQAIRYILSPDFSF